MVCRTSKGAESVVNFITANEKHNRSKKSNPQKLIFSTNVYFAFFIVGLCNVMVIYLSINNINVLKMINIDDLELKLKKIGIFYRSNTNALCFRLKKDIEKQKAIFWQKGETYREFLERCDKIN